MRTMVIDVTGSDALLSASEYVCSRDVYPQRTEALRARQPGL